MVFKPVHVYIGGIYGNPLMHYYITTKITTMAQGVDSMNLDRYLLDKSQNIRIYESLELE